jgi:hypothetical protein
MLTRENVTDLMREFARARDSALDANEDDFAHHMRAFVSQFANNPLCSSIVETLPAFDVSAWWDEIMTNLNSGYERRLEHLALPAEKDQQLQVYLDFARSFISDDSTHVSVDGFGNAFGKRSRRDAIDLATSLIVRPLAEELTYRVRKAAVLANPSVRELAGVPLPMIPSENELGVFLSHRSKNKPLVERYFANLKEIGFAPWYDKDAMVVGATLHRELAAGMDSSCAAVFFVTPEFEDQRWLKQEVDLAVNRKIERAAKFAIITLLFGDAEVPRPLKEYAYSKVEHDLDGLREIIRALPIELGPARWRKRVVDEK